MRRVFIAGNWKMNKSPAEARSLCEQLREALAGVHNVEIAIAPTLLAVPGAAEALQGSNIGVAAQNMHWEDSGAYTGEVSGPMLRAIGAQYVIIGHSERRQYFGETDESVNLKLRAALSHRLTGIMCVGESLDEREAGRMEERVEIQLRGGLAQLSDDDMASVVLAYEPIWAIGTGRTASSTQAQDAHAFIRSVLRARFNGDVADAVRIQYGGSVKPGNVAELLAEPDIDGALVGGASLTLDSFVALVKNGAAGAG